MLEDRRENRFKIKLAGKCRDDRGRRSSAEVTELSANGCKIRTSPILLTNGKPLWVKLGDRDFMLAKVQWRRSDTAGLMWEKTLHPAILEHIYAWHSAEHELPPNMIAPAPGVGHASVKRFV